jgi:hypothetical protein
MVSSWRLYFELWLQECHFIPGTWKASKGHRQVPYMYARINSSSGSCHSFKVLNIQLNDNHSRSDGIFDSDQIQAHLLHSGNIDVPTRAFGPGNDNKRKLKGIGCTAFIFSALLYVLCT